MSPELPPGYSKRILEEVLKLLDSKPEGLTVAEVAKYRGVKQKRAQYALLERYREFGFVVRDRAIIKVPSGAGLGYKYRRRREADKGD